MGISRKLYLQYLTSAKLHRMLVDIDHAIRCKRLQRMLGHFATHEEKEHRIGALRKQLEKEMQFINVRKVHVDELLEELEALLSFE